MIIKVIMLSRPLEVKVIVLLDKVIMLLNKVIMVWNKVIMLLVRHEYSNWLVAAVVD
jgi:hypothetical protein